VFCSGPEVDEALVQLLGRQHFVAPSQALGMHLARGAGDLDAAIFRVTRSLLNEVAGEAAQVAHVGGILGGDDEAELVGSSRPPAKKARPSALFSNAGYARPFSPSRVTPSRPRLRRCASVALLALLGIVYHFHS
jgi:hypothetical protein